ncbi:MAG: ribosome maturation factor RimP [Acidimicrobiales bacterium]
MSVSARVRALIEPLVASQGLILFDLEQAGPILRVTVDRNGGVGIDDITKTTRAISRAFDEHDPIASAYTLEVSSPGLERVLRTPAHYAWAVGRTVAVKTYPNHPVGRRFAGSVTASTETTVTVALDEPLGESITFNLGEIENARTTFVWGPAPKPGGPKNGLKTVKSEKKSKTTKIKKDAKSASPKEEKVQS